MKNILWILISVFAFGTVQAQKLEKSLLWEISGNGLEKPSYLYGTIHIIGTDDFFLTKNTKKVFKKSEQLALEIDLDEMQNPMAIFGMLGGIMMDNNQSLKNLLSTDDYNLVHNYIMDSMEMGMMATLVEKVKPIFLSQMIGMDLSSIGQDQPSVGGDSGSTSYEMVFSDMAKDQEIEMKGLETMAYQMSIFDSIPYKTQAEMLVSAIKGGGEDEAESLDELVELYKKQDIEALNTLMAGDPSIANFNDVLLINRNKNWIPVIGQMAREKPTFFAVGAGHLPGDEGVIKLLRKAGYKLKPLY
ncbi:MAG: TraB/GumN family protein [Saprospiraceae bacterium]